MTWDGLCLVRYDVPCDLPQWLLPSRSLALTDENTIEAILVITCDLRHLSFSTLGSSPSFLLPVMSPLGSRSLFRGAFQLSSTFPRRSISSFNKTPPPANKGPNSGSEQALPIGPYYESIIVTPQPIPATKPEEPPTSSPKSPRSTAKKNTAARKNPSSRAGSCH